MLFKLFNSHFIYYLSSLVYINAINFSIYLSFYLSKISINRKIFIIFSGLLAYGINLYLPIYSIELLEEFYNETLIMSLPFLTSPNLNSNPYINQIKTKIKSSLS